MKQSGTLNRWEHFTVMNETDRQRYTREYNRRYYEAHKLELAEKRKTARAAKLAAMSVEELAEYRRKCAAYQKQYRDAHPDKIAIWTARTWQRRAEELKRRKQEAVEDGR